MPRTSNLTGDLEQLWLQKGTRQRTFRQIIQSAESSDGPLATKDQMMAQARDLSDLIQEKAQEQAERTTELSAELTESIEGLSDQAVNFQTNIGDIQHTLTQDVVMKANIDPSAIEALGYQWYTAEEAQAAGWTDGAGYYTITGAYYQTVLTQILMTAEYMSEKFMMAESTQLNQKIDGVSQNLADVTHLFNGEIRRGFIDVIENQQTVRYFGIAITSREIFSSVTKRLDDNGNEVSTGGELYYAIDTDECFGLYTAVGWFFWRGKEKVGWFSTQDQHLHVGNIQMNKWMIINQPETFGIKFIG